jgi:hypothetical protein
MVNIKTHPNPEFTLIISEDEYGKIARKFNYEGLHYISACTLCRFFETDNVCNHPRREFADCTERIGQRNYYI